MLDAFLEKRNVVLEVLNRLLTMADELGSSSSRDRIHKHIIEKLEKNIFHLVIVGEFNHGKTTFVNALLGKQVFAVGVTPTTAVIHEIGYGKEPWAQVTYESGMRQELRFDEVKYFAIGHPAPVPDPGPVRLLEIRYPAEILRNHVALVDTPGVNDLSLARAEITYDYIPRSDAVLFLLDAGQLIKESERVFLQDKLLGQSRDKIVFVVTKKDILDSQDLEQAMGYVNVQLGKLIPNPRVHFVSAEKALEGAREESGMDELLRFLTTFLSEERGRIMLDNALGDGIKACGLLSKGIDAKKRALEMNVEEIDRRLAAIQEDLAGQAKTIEQRRAMIREEVAAIKAWTRRDLEGFVRDVCDQIPAIVDNARMDELKAHLGSFLEKTLRQWARRQTEEIAEALEKLAEKTIALVREDARDAAKRIASKMGADMHSPTIEVNTFAYDVGVAALAGVGVAFMFSNWMLGGVLLLAAPALALFMRGYVETETRNKAKQLAPQAVREAAAKVGPKLEEMIDAFASNLDA
ncbi:MAG TPA: dynamin family protein, partial [Polyangiaceae bacterium]|nr:dynamin family protein [Polyangiaceae bacterium]